MQTKPKRGLSMTKTSKASALHFELKTLLPAQFPLAKKFYKAHAQTSKTNRHDIICAAYEPSTQEISACLRIAPCGDCLLLRAVFVAPEFRGLGLASRLITFALQQSPNDVWTFPYHDLQALYSQLGFNKVAIDTVPDDVSQAYMTYTKYGQQLEIMHWQTH